MKKTLYFLLAVTMLFLWNGCGSETQTPADGTEANGEETTDETGPASRENIAVSVWEGQILTDGPAGKWMATIAFGEEMTLQGEEQVNEEKKKTFEKVALADGKIGWVRQDLIAKNAQLGAVIETAQLYKRPGVSNITDDKLEPGELVVVSQVQDQWTEVKGKNNSAHKRKEGWVLGEGLVTTDQIDLAVAVMITKAQAELNPLKRKEAFMAILDNTSYANSKFMPLARQMADAANPAENLAPDEAMITGNVVNVRSSTEIIDTNKLFIVKAGDIVKIVEKGMMDEISGKADYWYKISYNGQEGWIFGSNTTRAIEQ